MKRIAILIILPLLSGCGVYSYSDPQGHKLVLMSIGKDTKFDTLIARMGDTQIQVNGAVASPDANFMKAWADTAAAVAGVAVRAFVP